MKNAGLISLVGALLLVPAWSASNPAWQAGRIVDVHKDVTTKTLYWVTNTPITEDETSFTVSVHVKDKILTGQYELSRLQGAPPEEWVKDRAINLQVDGDTLYLRAPTGDLFKLKVVKRKVAAMMRPVTPAELAEVYANPAEKEESVTGFIPPTAKPAAAAVAAPAPVAAAPTPEPTGIISVRSTPYLADVYLDGQDMGYTPAKLSLPPGKHTVRFEKQGYKTWSKEITLTAGSELLVDATLEKK